MDEAGPRSSQWPPAAARSAARRTGDRVSVAGLDGARGNPSRGNTFVLGRGRSNRQTASGAGRGARVRDESSRPRDSLSSSGARCGGCRRVSMGRGAQEEVAASGTTVGDGLPPLAWEFGASSGETRRSLGGGG